MAAESDFDALTSAPPAPQKPGTWFGWLKAKLPERLHRLFGLDMTEAEDQAFRDDQQIW